MYKFVISRAPDVTMVTHETWVKITVMASMSDLVSWSMPQVVKGKHTAIYSYIAYVIDVYKE